MKKSVFISVAFLLSLTLFLNSCKKDQPEVLPLSPVTINTTSDEVSLINSQNTFAFDIFKKVLEGSEDSKNIIISPLSISSALSMALNGANGDTRNAMLEALRQNGMSAEAINASYKSLTGALLNVDSRVLISVANSIWTEKNFAVKNPFANILNEYYNTESKSFDITDPDAVKPINTWIELKTNGLIKNMLESLDPFTEMLLINAIYFKGKWNSQFDKDKTIDQPFYRNPGDQVQVPMMKQTETEFKSYRGENFGMAEFPYGQGNFVMDVILPDANSGTDQILASLDNTSFNAWLNDMGKSQFDLSFPRFKYAYKKELKDILADMGMGLAFTDAADFSNISDIDLYISFVLHQAFIETNEEGTEAAAATIVGIGTTSMPLQTEFNMNRPFIYIIRESTTNTILFMGRVADPLAE